MTLNLKRKRDKDTESRKTRKTIPDNVLTDETSLNDIYQPADGKDSMDAQETAGGAPDDEEWGGIPSPVKDDIASVGRPGTKPKKPPTGEELRAIKDATDLFRSSSFKLQIDALLPNVRPKESRIPPLDRFLLSLHSFLISIPPVSPQHPLEAAHRLLKKNVSVPYCFPLPSEETNWKVAFEKPSDITLVGSWANKVSVKGKDGTSFGVDLAVEMPEGLFQEKDYLNGRFFHKRAFYLATIAAALKRSQNELKVDISYESLSDNPRLTTLVLHPRKDDSPTDFTKLNARICIIPVLPSPCPIPLHRLSPSHSNIRVTSDSSAVPSDQSPATPLYNTALLTALTPKSSLLSTHFLKENSPAFSDALTLLRVWANQRGYGPGTRMCVRGFDGKGPWWAGLLGLLISGEERTATGAKSTRKPLGRGLSSYQLFRAALDFLAKHEFDKDHIYLRSQDGHRFSTEEYAKHHQAVFVDSSSTVNLLADIPVGTLEMLRYDARKTLETLDHSSISRDPFTEVFLKEQRDLPTRFDTIIRVDLSYTKIRNSSLHTIVDHGSQSNALLASLDSLLHQGLGNRTKAAVILHPSPEARPISQALPSNPDIIHIGLILDPEHAFRLVDHGPAANEPDQAVTERFRELWGDKAELRRFKDGNIDESVVWDVKNTDERAHIPALVVKHLLKRHLGISEAYIQTWQPSFDPLLCLPDSISKLYQAFGVPAGFKSAMTAFDTFVKGVKGLDDELPLAILNISASSEYLRYTSVFTPVPLSDSSAPMMPPSARYLAPMEIIIEFEKSSRWPDDLRAIQKIKLAFFERVATVLMTSMKGLKATVVVGDGVTKSDIQDQSRLEILTADGWAFSARIWHDREATLLDRIIDNKSLVLPHIAQKPAQSKGKDYQNALEAREVYTRRFIHSPRHHRAIASLSHLFPAYPGTVRLVKRWFASHWLLEGHVSDEVIEIICASFFIGDGHSIGKETVAGDERANVPASRERGFSSVIEFLKDWKWEDGLFVPLYGGADAEESFKSPTVSKAGVWTVSTELDKTGRMWTSAGPDGITAHRVRALARATWDHLQGMEQGNLNVQTMFAHPTDDYDFVVQLNRKLLPRYFQNVSVDPSVLSGHVHYANLQDETDEPLRPGFDPARLLFDDLKRIYVDTFKIFYDPLGGDRFGAVWDPSLRQPRPFRVLGGFSSMPAKENEKAAKDKGSVILNESGILTEIKRMGSGLITEIVVRV